MSAAPELRPNNAALSFDDDVEAVLTAGPTIISLRRLHLAIRDPRLKRFHLVILSHLMAKLNYGTGTAFPSRAAIAEEEQLSEKSVENGLYDLRRWGYIAWMRRPAPQVHRGKLLHYTLAAARWTDEKIRSAISEFVAATNRGKVPHPAGTQSPLPIGEFEQKVPPPAGRNSPSPGGEFSPKVPARSGEKVHARCGDSNLKKELVEKGDARAKQARSARAQKTRLPESWSLPPDWRAYAREQGATDAQADHIARTFHRYLTGPDATGGGLKADWRRTWENWVDREVARGLPRVAPAVPAPANGVHISEHVRNFRPPPRANASAPVTEPSL